MAEGERQREQPAQPRPLSRMLEDDPDWSSDAYQRLMEVLRKVDEGW